MAVVRRPRASMQVAPTAAPHSRTLRRYKHGARAARGRWGAAATHCMISSVNSLTWGLGTPETNHSAFAVSGSAGAPEAAGAGATAAGVGSAGPAS